MSSLFKFVKVLATIAVVPLVSSCLLSKSLLLSNNTGPASPMAEGYWRVCTNGTMAGIAVPVSWSCSVYRIIHRTGNNSSALSPNGETTSLTFTPLKTAGEFVVGFKGERTRPIHILALAAEKDLFFGYSFNCKLSHLLQDAKISTVEKKLGISFENGCEIQNEKPASIIAFFENSALFEVNFQAIAVRLSDDAGRSAFSGPR